MVIKRALTLAIFALTSLTSLAQEYKTNIKQRFTEFNQYMVKGEFDKSMDYIPEAIFTIVPRAEMVKMFEQLLNNKDMEVKFIGFDIKEIAEVRKIDSYYYAKIKYRSAMTLKMKTSETENADEKSTRLSMTKQAFANTFGSDHVKLDELTETFTIHPIKNSWAISKNGETEWKFVNIEPKQRLMMEKVLPKVLIEESIN